MPVVFAGVMHSVILSHRYDDALVGVSVAAEFLPEDGESWRLGVMATLDDRYWS